MNSIFSNPSSSHRHGRSLLLAIVVGAFAMTGAATVNAQATAGKIFGKAPSGYAVAAHNDSTGTQREAKVGSNGRYSLRELPVGTYTVTLKEDGHGVMKHLNVPVIVGRGSEVDFDCTPGQCAETASK
ncbi:carboxypeptidase regulatory-like domain-containing protein [Rhodanobacter glycinis]|uniref:Carboxypeptidase regulatory-like domain-containing protein n=1 Tax=Rhodanobacter glycinis TaxID=582702 RepID=A0A5B9E4Q0_9GAMM|nr:carboxypeptidase-like regulatory domain-containing protein [Rhodanobacter glycinis]QEE25126.1 carboxypeptidase regulatory-like domain-containing protein [Rhodanobacter glycinis]